MRKFLDRLDKKYSRYGIENLMLYVIGAMALIYFLDYALYANYEVSLNSLMMFDRDAIFRGELWRIVTFAFMSPLSNPLFLVFSLYFYWISGNGLEAQWGRFKFNVFYFFGLLCTLASGLITGYATNSYVNLTLFLAFAILYPNYEILLFFILPIKVKYIAIVDAIGLLLSFVISNWRGKIALIVALGNLILFFGSDIIDKIKYAKRRHDFKKSVNRK